MSWLLPLLVAAVLCWLVELVAAHRARKLGNEAIEVAKAALEQWRESEAGRLVYADAFLSVVSSLTDENATEEQLAEAIKRAVDSVHDYVAVQQEHREV